MIFTVAESLKDTWTSIFRRKGADGTYTRLFDNLDPLQRNMLLGEFKPEGLELPVIGSIKNAGNWLILTTERLVWSIEGKRHEVAATLIRDATADLKQLQRSNHSKLVMKQLQIATLDGREYLIELEPGAPLGGVWSILKNVGARNRAEVERAR